MRWTYKLPLRLRSLFSKQRADVELDEELEFHVHEQETAFLARVWGRKTRVMRRCVH